MNITVFPVKHFNQLSSTLKKVNKI